MKTMSKSELAAKAGVSLSTFSRWLHRHDDALLRLGVTRNAHLIPPVAVEYICREYGIEV